MLSKMVKWRKNNMSYQPHHGLGISQSHPLRSITKNFSWICENKSNDAWNEILKFSTTHLNFPYTKFTWLDLAEQCTMPQKETSTNINNSRIYT